MSLDYYLTMAKNSKGLALVDLINKATSSQLVTFKQILHLESVQNLKGSHPKALNLLQLFTYGNVSDYNITHHDELSPIQLRNLKILTLLTNIDKISQFDVLKSAIQVANDSELEDLLIEMIERNLISGRLDQKLRTLNCSYKYPRDQLNNNTSEIFIKWIKNIESVIEEIDLIIRKDDEHTGQRAAEQLYYDNLVNEAMEKLSKVSESEMTMGSGSMFRRNERKRDRERK